ncbi:MerR family transcriptional regulator [Consotaella aegiceratis]|uniref:MerR family transcriptional regulator n=1 Tax=Consotaella aegiceratis TaxID=3097961 RepID=UPI002F3E7FE3
MADKSVDAFRTISEVAESLELPQHVLRFWETRFQQIRPLKRGGGRRYYRPEDVELLKGIQYLLYDKGFTIRGVQRILRENGNRFVMAIGSGDLSGLDSAQGEPSPATPPPPEADDTHVEDIDLIVGETPVSRPASAAPRAREPRVGDDIGPLSREETASLNDVVLELLECKRLLDQVR